MGNTSSTVSSAVSSTTTSSFISSSTSSIVVATTTTSSSSVKASSSSSVVVASSSVKVSSSSTPSAVLTSTLKNSIQGSLSGCSYNIDGVGSFNTRWYADWTSSTTQDMTNIISNAYTIGSSAASSPKQKRSLSSLITSLSNALSMKIASSKSLVSTTTASLLGSTVSSGSSAVSSSTSSMGSSTQLYTSYNDILYGSVRATILLSNATGFTSSMSATQEIDYNWLAYHSSYTTNTVSDASSAWHEYRVDWLPGVVNYYIDTQLISSSLDSPAYTGLWIWNAWDSNGSDDSVFQLRSIDAYFNRTSVASTSSCAAGGIVSTASSLVANVVSTVSSVAASLSTSSVVATPTTLSTSTTSTVAPPATVSFTTITQAWTGAATTTTTVLNGLQATVIVQTPGKVTSTSASITATANGYVYVTSTTDSGTFSAVQTTTITPAKGTTATVLTVYPTPVTTCTNTGIAYAGYSNVYAGGQATYGYPSFTPEAFKTKSPKATATGTTNYIAEVNGGSANVQMYGSDVGTSNWVIDHTFYVFARQDGYFSFNIPYVDDLTLVWIGSKAVTGWTRSNADIVQFWSSQIATQTPQTLAYYLTTGTYLPVRVMWANGGGAGELDFNIYAPDGTNVLASNKGLGTGSGSVDIVRFPCDKSLGEAFPVWGSET